MARAILDAFFVVQRIPPRDRTQTLVWLSFQRISSVVLSQKSAGICPPTQLLKSYHKIMQIQMKISMTMSPSIVVTFFSSKVNNFLRLH